MVEKVVWSIDASKDRNEIISYWYNRNKSTVYGNKLILLFKEAVKTIQHFPQIGKPTTNPTIRIKIVIDYLIIYKETNLEIRILSIWDSRQNPVKLEEKLIK